MYFIIEFITGNYFTTCFLIGLVAAFVSVNKQPKPVPKKIVWEKYFSYYLLFAVGINNLINFVFHVFFGDTAAAFIGWDQSPFQAEVGYASLGIGIAGVLAYKSSFPFRAATMIPPVVFSLGAAGGHIYYMIKDNNFSPGNVGLILPIDIILLIVGLIFMWRSYKYPVKKDN